jgi:signal transduction histidine kinase/ligand-binding sensor domain-containing protein
MKKTVPATLFFFWMLTAFAQPVAFTNISIEQGLSQSVVNCVFQDSRGFLWFGTQNGLNKYNGYNFEVYTYNPTDTNSLSNNWVYSIDEDRQGDLWIGTKGGLNQFDPGKRRFRKIRFSSGSDTVVASYVYDAIVDSKGSVVINTPPLLTIYNPVTGKSRQYRSPLPRDVAVNDNRIPLLEDSRGLIWAGSTTGLACLNPASGTFSTYTHHPGDEGSISDNNITALHEDRSGAIWVGTSNGLNRFDPDKKRFTTFFHIPGAGSLSGNFIRAITCDARGSLFVGTEGNGITRMDLTRDGRYRFSTYSSEENGLSINIVLDLLIDRSENLWAGTLQGIGKTDLKRPKFRLYRNDNTPGSVDLLGNVIASIYKDEDGILWVGNWGQGLNRYDRKSGRVYHFSTRQSGNKRLTNDFVHVIFADADRRLWIGTRDGLFIYDRQGERFIRPAVLLKDPVIPAFPGVRIFMIIQDHYRNYWVGTQNGLYRFSITGAKEERFAEELTGAHKISSNLIYSLLEDRDGLIWIATLNGLDCYDPASKTIQSFRKSQGKTSGLSDNFIISLCEDSKGDIWIGTSTYLNRYNKRDGTFTYYAQEQGLPNNRIFEILEDDRKNLWVATGHGLSRFDTVSGTFRTYSAEDGLQGPEFNLRACYKAPDGEVFFGGMQGFNSFFPDSLDNNPFLPGVVITAFYKTTPKGERVYFQTDSVEMVTLNYDDRSFTIEFAALEFTNPQKNRYAYKIDGITDDWTEIGNRRFVPFTNLAPGTYTFRVRGANNDGVWSKEEAAIRIVIDPPWWKSWPAYAGYLLLILIILLIYVRQREAKLVRARKILEERVKERTLLIEQQNTEIIRKNEELKSLNQELRHLNATKDKFFSIIAHDLRNPFNTIIGLTDIFLENLEKYDPAKVKRSLNDIRETSGHAFDLLQNLLIWARSRTGSIEFNPAPFDLRERIEASIELIGTQAAKKNIMIFSEVDEPINIMGDANMVDTIFRNLITNALKFTHPEGSVTIKAVITGNRCEVAVSDNGIGMSKEIVSKLFRMDAKVTRKGTDSEKGSGLGLLLCEEFVGKHGGKFRVESMPGEGSTFFFTLPLA